MIRSAALNLGKRFIEFKKRDTEEPIEFHKNVGTTAFD